MMKTKLMNDKGFTLVEMMIAIAIIGVLAAFALPSYNKYVEKNDVLNGRTALAQLNQSMQLHLAKFDKFDDENARGDVAVAAIMQLDAKAIQNYSFDIKTITGGGVEQYVIIATPNAGKKLPSLWMNRAGDVYKCSDEESAKAQNKADKCSKI